MLDFLQGVIGERLDRAGYKLDFRVRRADAGGFRSWKLERRQHFVEPHDPSWQALVRGDWEESVRLIEAEPDALVERALRGDQEVLSFIRVRVVEKPIVPYLQWEFHAFREQAKVGFAIRVIGPELLKQFEEDGPLPELINVSADTLYRIIYKETGESDGAVRYTGAEIVSRYIAFMEGLWEQGEDFTAFFEREVAHLPPPRGV